MTRSIRGLLLAGCWLACPVFAAPTPTPASTPSGTPAADARPTPAQQALCDAWSAAIRARQRGPQDIALKDEARLAPPAGCAFVPKQEAMTLMEATGNGSDDRFLGLVLPLSPEENRLVSIDHEPAGHIKDDDARHRKSDELLENFKKGTGVGNARHGKVGVAPPEVTRWIEAPAYEFARVFGRRTS